jgi:hypothetical protein
VVLSKGSKKEEETRMIASSKQIKESIRIFVAKDR